MPIYMKYDGIEGDTINSIAVGIDPSGSFTYTLG